MFKVFVDFFKNKQIRNRIFITLGLLLVFKLGSNIPVPGLSESNITLSGSASFLAIANLLSGGSLENISILSLGVGPYITASIIIELLSKDVIPSLTELAKSGKKGRQQMDKYTRYLAVFMGIVQATFTMITLQQQNTTLFLNPGIPTYIYIGIIMTAGTMFTLWLADQITTKGIGNGVSVIIFAGIVSNMPSNFQEVYNAFLGANPTSNWGIYGFIGYIVMFLLIIVLVVVLQLAERRLPTQHSSGQALSKAKGDFNYIPLKINSSGVVPVIFASSLVTAPLMITSWINANWYNKLNSLVNWFDWKFLLFYAILIILFCYFYTHLTVDPTKMSEDLGKQGTYIPGVRPGNETKSYISKVLNRITALGSLILVFLALLPYVVVGLTGISQKAAVGGTGILIVVGVAMETVKQLKSQLTTKSYKGFIGK